jgi:hypothetical protein
VRRRADRELRALGYFDGERPDLEYDAARVGLATLQYTEHESAEYGHRAGD